MSITGRIQARIMCCFLLSYLLVSFSLGKFLSSSSAFMILTFWNGSHFVAFSSILCFTAASPGMLCVFSRNSTVVKLLIASHQVVPHILVCSIVSDTQFGQLSKFVSARLPHSEVTFPPFVIEKYFVGEVLQYFVSILFFLSHLISILFNGYNLLLYIFSFDASTVPNMICRSPFNIIFDSF